MVFNAIQHLVLNGKTVSFPIDVGQFGNSVALALVLYFLSAAGGTDFRCYEEPPRNR